MYSLTPEGYVPVMKKLDVSCIVRFNSKCYDRNVFLVNGIRWVIFTLFCHTYGADVAAAMLSALAFCFTFARYITAFIYYSESFL